MAEERKGPSSETLKATDCAQELQLVGCTMDLRKWHSLDPRACPPNAFSSQGSFPPSRDQAATSGAATPSQNMAALDRPPCVLLLLFVQS